MKQVSFDSDESGALNFLKDNLDTLIKKSDRPHCVPRSRLAINGED
ncbi:MAG: hypothetical protein M1548_08820 [Actinobacteria bacterium]|nr:hypothetical protein [Actinomycetota bacterium]